MSRISRRRMISATLGSGFALAVRPLAAQPITTSEEGLLVGEVKIPVRDGLMPAYRAVPRHAKNPPIMLVVHEIFGVHEHIKDVCRRFARLGYLAVAPDLFVRQGDVSKLRDIDQILRRVVAHVPDAQVLADLDATAAWAAGKDARETSGQAGHDKTGHDKTGHDKTGHDKPSGDKAEHDQKVDTSGQDAKDGKAAKDANESKERKGEVKGDRDRLGIVGFCWGGRVVWLYAAHNRALKAGVAFYGRLIGDRTPNTPRHPLDVVPALKAPVMGLYGVPTPASRWGPSMTCSRR